MRLLALWLAAGLLAMVTAAQPKLTAEAQRILDLASASPPEFHAWAILKLLPQNLIKDPVTRRQLIEHAYELSSAARARYPVKMLSGVPPGSRSRLIALGSRSGLDALSLGVDTVRLMLPVDKQKARQMFSDIPKPAIASLTCDDDLIPQLDEYYQALGRIAQEAFTAKERQREDHVNFLLDYIGAINSPAQLVPVAAMLAAVNVTADERQLLDAKFGAAMDSVNPDDRSFADVTAALTPLLNSDVMPAFQRFISNHAASARCQHSSPPLQVTVAGPASSPAAAQYNGELLWQNPQAQSIQKMASDLRIQNSRVLTDADRSDPQWRMSFTSYMDAVSAWQPGEGESDAVFFHEKTSAWMAAAELAPAADSREYALGEAVRFIAGSAIESSSPAEWFLEARQPDAEERVKTDLLRDYAASGNPVLALSAALTKLTGANVVN